MNSHLGGGLILKRFVESQNGYDETNPDKIKELTKVADEQLASYVYLVNSDQGKYGSVIKGLHSQKALQNDQYPKTIIESNNVLSTHRFDNSKDYNNPNNRNREKFDKKRNEKKVEEKDDESPPLSFT